MFDFLFPTSKMVIAFQDHYNLLKNGMIFFSHMFGKRF